MKITLTFQVLMGVLLISGCSWGVPAMENRNPVKKIGIDEYIYDFKDNSDCHTDDCYKLFAEKKLESLDMIPSECQNGVDVFYRGGPNNGWAFVKFRCARK
jgi:hypothetical protein